MDLIAPSVGAQANLNKTILLIEDDRDDIFIFQRALKAAQISNPMIVLTTGQAAVDYLSRIREYSDEEKYPLPFIVFLDLKLPYLDGFEVLKWIRKQPALAALVVVVLSGSNETIDHQRAYTLGACSYLVKPAAAEDLRQFMDSMTSFWG